LRWTAQPTNWLGNVHHADRGRTFAAAAIYHFQQKKGPHYQIWLHAALASSCARDSAALESFSTRLGHQTVISFELSPAMHTAGTARHLYSPVRQHTPDLPLERMTSRLEGLGVNDSSARSSPEHMSDARAA